MNNEIKILLTIELAGGTLVRKSEPDVITCIITKEDVNPKKYKGKKEAKDIVRKRKNKHFSFEVKPAKQHIELSYDAYYHMIGECPSWVRPKVWKKMTISERLESHLTRLCEYHRGKSFTYTVLED